MVVLVHSRVLAPAVMKTNRHCASCSAYVRFPKPFPSLIAVTLFADLLTISSSTNARLDGVQVKCFHTTAMRVETVRT